MKKSTIFWIAGLLILGALAVGLTSTAFAQDTQPPDEVTSPWERMKRGGGFGMRGGRFDYETAADLLGMSEEELISQLKAGETLADLAEKAGIDLQTLRDAVTQSKIDDVRSKIEQAVNDGEMTQAEADWLLSGIENGYRPGLGVENRQTAGLEAAATALGLDVDELSNQLWAGRTLADLADQEGVDLQTVLDAMEATHSEAARARIEAALADGTITQEQADWMLEGIENGYGKGPGFGMRGLDGLNEYRRGGFGGRGRGGHDPQDCPMTAPTGDAG